MRKERPIKSEPCTLEDAYVYIEATLHAYENGHPNFNGLEENWYIPDTGYYCGGCHQDFKTWAKFKKHLAEKPETCWNCEGPLNPGREVVASGGIFCSEDCHEAFTTTPETSLTTRKDTNQWPNQSNN
jgi:hypothetical protein